MSAFTKKYQLTLFFVLTLLLTWAMWIPALIVKQNGGDSILAPDSGVGSRGRWMPGVAAALLITLSYGRSAVGQLFHSLRTWRVGYFWYAFVLLFPVGLFYLGRGIDALLGNSYEVIAPVTELPAAMIPFVIIFALPGVLPTHTDTVLTLAAALLVIPFTGGADFTRRRRRVQAAV